MKKQWQAIRQVVYLLKEDKPYLTVINNSGKIIKANSRMKREFDLPDPSTADINFIDLIKPANKTSFKNLIQAAFSENLVSTGLCLKNGVIHNMKWIMYSIEMEGQRLFLCGGRKLHISNRFQLLKQIEKDNYQLLIDSLNSGVIYHDSNGEWIFSNNWIKEKFKISQDFLNEHKGIYNLWESLWYITNESGVKIQYSEAPFIKALNSGEKVSQLLLLRLTTDEIKWLHFTSIPLFDKQSIPYAVVSNVIDLTKEKLDLKDLLVKKAVFKSFMKQSPNLKWVVDEEATLIEANNSFFDYFGFKESETLNKNIAELLPDSVSESLYKKHLEVLNSGKSAEFTERVKWADGKEYIFYISIILIEGLSGKRMLGGLAVDLTSKYDSEKKLKEVNDRLLLFSRATTDAIWEWDMQSGRVFRNDALMDMIGYESDHHKGLSWWFRSIHPEDRNRVSDKVKQSTDNGSQSWEEEYRFKCADGTYKHMRDKGFIVYENGLPVRMIGSIQDITEIKKMEDEFFEKKLQQQKELSETIVRVQEKERTRIGHELHDNVNQLLSTTKLFVDMINPVSKEEKVFKSKSIDYILMAIEEIRKLSKELVVPQLKNNSLVDNIKQLIEDIKLSGTIQIKFAHDHENDIMSQGKKVTIFRIVQEQIKNIIKHSKASHVEILLQCKGDLAELSIIDNGIGFTPQKTQNGIGFSSIYERTRFYNGTMNLISEPGKGCKLVVKIPCVG